MVEVAHSTDGPVIQRCHKNVLLVLTRQIKSPEDLIKRFDFKFRPNHSGHEDELAFKRALCRYLRGRGHVMSEFLKNKCQLVAESMHEEECKDPLSRVNRFYRHASGKTVPAAGRWSMVVSTSSV
jgi:hypothetical protein